MKHKPFSLKMITMGYSLAPILTILRASYFNSMGDSFPIFGPRSVFYSFGAMDWLTIVLFPVVAFGIYQVSRWGYFLFLAFSAFLIMKTSYLYFQNPAPNGYVVLLVHLSIIGVVGFFLQKHIVAPYFNPNLRWWVRDERFRLNHVSQAKYMDKYFDCEVLDMSLSGCFIQIKSQTVEVGAMLWVFLEYDGLKLAVPGKIMRDVKGATPGYGIMFVGLGPVERKQIQNVMDRLLTLKAKPTAPAQKAA